MAKGRVPLTRDGRNRICGELEVLKTEKRREVAKALAEARAHGDLSENAEYDAAKADQAKNEKKIAELEDLLMRAQIIDESAMPNDEVSLGVTVRVKDLKTGEEFDYMFVSEEESDFSTNKISISSPVGKALLGHKVGEEVMIKVPVGSLKYAILSIKR